MLLGSRRYSSSTYWFLETTSVNWIVVNFRRRLYWFIWSLEQWFLVDFRRLIGYWLLQVFELFGTFWSLVILTFDHCHCVSLVFDFRSIQWVMGPLFLQHKTDGSAGSVTNTRLYHDRFQTGSPFDWNWQMKNWNILTKSGESFEYLYYWKTIWRYSLT